MTIYWVNAPGDDALEALAAVERALAAGDTGEPPAAAPGGAALPAEPRDPYLAEGLATLHSSWAIDQQRIVVSRRPGLAAAINAFQRLVRRATWWYATPQWQQVSDFHGATVRAIDVLLDRHRQNRARIAALEAKLADVHALERQIQVMWLEQRELRRRIAELEAQLARAGAEAPERQDDRGASAG